MTGSSLRRTVTIAAFFSMITGLCITGGAQRAESRGAQVRSWNNQLLDVYSRHLASPASGNSGIRSQAASILRQRADALENLVRQDPAEALRLGFSQDLRSDLAAAFPDSDVDLESPGVWEGPIEYTIEDNLALGTHRNIYSMKYGTEDLRINFAAAEPQQLKSGDVLRVRGMRVRSEIAAADGTRTYTTTSLAANMCSPIGEQKTIVLLVNMPGTTPPDITPASVSDTFFSASGRSVSEFWRETSFGATWATGDVKGWYTLNANYTCDQNIAIRDAAIKAADSDVDFRQYNRVFVVISGMASCGWAGISNVGCGSSIKTADGSFTVSTSWLLAKYFYNRDQAVELTTHEGGHGLGLSHSASRDFGIEPLAAPGTAGAISEYGDILSAMGGWSLGHYTAPQKAQLGWMTSDYETITGNGSFSIQPMETSGPLHALKIRRGADDNSWLWVEYRTNTGLYDSTLPSQIFTGGLFHFLDSYTGSRSNLLDFTGDTDDFSDSALAGSWTDPYSSVSIATANPSSSSLNVTVSYGLTPCVEAAPTITLSPSNPSAYAGDVVNYSVAVKNNDTSACAARTFEVSSLAPGTWTTTFSQSSLTIAPTLAASANMAKVVPAGSQPATYSVDAVVANQGNSVEGLANVTVKPEPVAIAVSLSVAGTTFKNNSTVPITAKVLQGAAGAASATVKFTMTKPDGTTETKSVGTSTSGTAAWSSRIGPKEPKGSYQVTATAVLGSQSAVAAPVTFVVQ